MSKGNARLYACCARIELNISGALTLKDRRAVIRSLLERLKSRFNLSMADLDGGENGAGRAALGIAAVANEGKHAKETIQQAIEFIYSDTRIEPGNIEFTDL